MSDELSAAGLPIGDVVEPRVALAPGRTSLEGRWVRLIAVEPEQAAALFGPTHGSPEREAVWTYMPYGPFDDAGAMADWLAEIAASIDPTFLTVTDGTDRPIGVVSFLNVDLGMRRLELGNIWYVPGAQRTRANTETVFLMLGHAFDALGHRRVEWKCDALNARSRTAAERLGFTFEGVFRRHMVIKGRNRDTAWFSMLDSEWPAIRVAFGEWFDAEAGGVSLATLTRRALSR